ncbi:MAG: hypothetical protein QNJ55_12925 [Xenococcus sp. MO_188.B8]|nr:hypothetical protein [Xenococcus sp. MO_188.B8]
MIAHISNYSPRRCQNTPIEEVASNLASLKVFVLIALEKGTSHDPFPLIKKRLKLAIETYKDYSDRKLKNVPVMGELLGRN